MMMKPIGCQRVGRRGLGLAKDDDDNDDDDNEYDDDDDDESDYLSAGWKARAWIGQSCGTSSCQVIDPCTVLQPHSVLQCSRYEL